jgi:hypothetical protein
LEVSVLTIISWSGSKQASMGTNVKVAFNVSNGGLA